MMMHDKKILVIAPLFFGYEMEICKEIQRRGAEVNYLADRPFSQPWQTALTRIAPMLIQPWVNRLYRKQLTKFTAANYDVILVVNGQTLSKQVLIELKLAFPKAQFILYMWDSLDNRPGMVRKMVYYDKIFSFDPEDARKYRVSLRPLFFIQGFERPLAHAFDYQLSFIGTVHSDRYQVICKLRKQLASNIKTYWYLYLQAPSVYWVYRTLKPAMRHARKEEFIFAPLNKKRVQEVFAGSQVVLDIEHPHQRGLTMRTFETMGANKKLITTNTSIRQYDFFKEGNICVIDRNNPEVPLDFWTQSYQPILPALYYKYSLAGWLDEVLGLKN